MKIKKVLILILLSIYTNTISAEILKCSDESVKELVIDITLNRFRDHLVIQGIEGLLGIDAKWRGYPTYKQWKKIENTDDEAKTVISYVDKTMNKIELSIRGIRTSAIHRDVEKVLCDAQIIVKHNGKALNIEYDAQLSADNYIYVNVYGLD